MTEPTTRHPVCGKELRRNVLRLEDGVKADDFPALVSDNEEGLGVNVQPLQRRQARLLGVVFLEDRDDGVEVARTKVLHGEARSAGRKECLPDHRIVEQVQDVGGVAPQLVDAGIARLDMQLAPGSPLEVAVRVRVHRPELARNRLAHGVVNNQTVASTRGEGQHSHALECVVGRRLRKHGVQDRVRHATHHRTCLEDPSSQGIGDVGEVKSGERIYHRGERLDFQITTRICRDRGCGELERKRVAMCKPVDATRGRRVNAHVFEQVERFVVGDALQWQAAEACPVPLPRHQPIGDRRLPAAQHHSHVLWQ
jgi:hypothetical protein